MAGSGYDIHNLHVNHINLAKLYRQDGTQNKLPEDGRHLPDLFLQHCDSDHGCPHLHGHHHPPWRGDRDHCQHQQTFQYVLVIIHQTFVIVSLQVWPRSSPWFRTLARRRTSPPPPPESPAPRVWWAACSLAARRTRWSMTHTPRRGRSTCTVRWASVSTLGRVGKIDPRPANLHFILPTLSICNIL